MSVRQIEGYKTWRYKFKRGGDTHRGDTKIPVTEPIAKAIAAEAVIIADVDKLIERGIKSAKVGMRLGEAVEKYWIEHGQFHYRNALTNLRWVAKVIGPKKALQKITDLDVKDLIKRRRAEGGVRNGIVDGKQTYRPLSLRGIDETTNLLRLVMMFAVKEWKVPVPNMPNWKEHRLYNHRKLKRAGHNAKRALTHDEEAAIADFETDDCRDVRLFLTLQGMRIGRECLAMEWDRNVDFGQRRLLFEQKGGTDRVVMMAPGVFELLKAQVGKHPVKVWTFKCQRARRRKDPKNPRRLITIREEGQFYPMSYSYFTGRRYADWHHGAGVMKRSHDLRHTFAMRAIYARVSIRNVSQLLGHSETAITEQNYIEPMSVEEQVASLSMIAKHQLAVRNLGGDGAVHPALVQVDGDTEAVVSMPAEPVRKKGA